MLLCVYPDWINCGRIEYSFYIRLEKSDEDILKVEMRLLDYLEESEGKAFTAKALHKRCIEENHIKISVNQIEKILSDLYSVGKVRFSVKENVRYYLIP